MGLEPYSKSRIIKNFLNSQSIFFPQVKSAKQIQEETGSIMTGLTFDFLFASFANYYFLLLRREPCGEKKKKIRSLRNCLFSFFYSKQSKI